MRTPALVLALLVGLGAAAAAEDFRVSQVRFYPSANQGLDVELSRFGTFVALADWTEGNSVRVLDGNWELLWRHRQQVYWGGTFRHASVLQFAPDESFLLFPAYRTENDIAVVNPRTGEPLSVLTDHADTVDCLALSPDGSILVSAAGKEVFLWRRDASTFKVVDRLAGHTGSVSSISFTPDGSLVALSENDDMTRRIILCRVDGDRLQTVFRQENEEHNLSNDYEQIAFSPDGKWLAAGYADSLLVFERAGQALRPAQTVPAIELGSVLSVTFSPDGALLLTGHYRDIRAWSLAAGQWKPAFTFSPHVGNVRDMEFTLDGTRLAIAGKSETNGLGLWAASGTGPSALGTILALLTGRISTAQKRFVDEALAQRVLSSIAPTDLAPRDMFETEAEYAQRRARTQAAVAALLQVETERRFGAERSLVSGALYDVSVPLQSQGTYAIDDKTYTFRFMDSDAMVKLERDAARELYQNWQKARVRATRVQTADGTTYADFRVVLPVSARQVPLGLSENPFTGEKLDRYGVHVPSIMVGPDLLLRDLVIEGVFPALYRSYADHSLGRVTLQNTGSTTISGLSIRFFVPGLMKTPTAAAAPDALGVGQSVDAGVRALFDASILDRGEGGSVSAELTVEYTSGGKAYKETVIRPIGLLNRNAIRWTDDRKVGAFMTVNDPAFLRFSGQVVGMVDDLTTNVLTHNLLSAVRLFGAMKAAGIRYVVDPASPYETLSRDKAAIDYLRFPLETLDQKSGDCDDLAVLYNSLLESVGVPTAFIATPGHIFAAFDLGISPELAARVFPKSDAFIVRDDGIWIPVETTIIEEGFMKAWQAAALEWREGKTRGDAAFFSTSEAWKVYVPSGFAGAQPVAVPPNSRVVAFFNGDLDAFRAAALGPRETELLAALDKSPSPAADNHLGVLYAQFGLLDKALGRFEKAIAADGYIPALINAANVYVLRQDQARALQYLQRAEKKEPANARVLVALALSYALSGNDAGAKKAYEKMAKLDPALAARYPMFGPAGGAGGAAAGGAGSAAQGRAARADAAQKLFGSDWAE
ncbi:MAG TPA: hypothetical protein VMV03_10040 [Spirochaetia bacterium]|nr:hypothetical protein [Spirochaetia bacterium]